MRFAYGVLRVRCGACLPRTNLNCCVSFAETTVNHADSFREPRLWSSVVFHRPILFVHWFFAVPIVVLWFPLVHFGFPLVRWWFSTGVLWFSTGHLSSGNQIKPAETFQQCADFSLRVKTSWWCIVLADIECAMRFQGGGLVVAGRMACHPSCVSQCLGEARA